MLIDQNDPRWSEMWGKLEAQTGTGRGEHWMYMGSEKTSAGVVCYFKRRYPQPENAKVTI